VLTEIQGTRAVPPFATIYVSHIDGPTRVEQSLA
jgi:hypothetical protein